MEGFTRYSNQPISQGVTLLFFFTEKKKRSKKRKEFAFHLYYKVKYHTKITHQQNSPGGVTGGLSAVTLPFLHLKLGRKVSGDPPLSLLKRKKEAKKEKSSRFPCATRSNITRRLHVAKIPRRGKQAAAAAVTLPFLLLKLGRKVGGDPPRA